MKMGNQTLRYPRHRNILPQDQPIYCVKKYIIPFMYTIETYIEYSLNLIII